MSKIILGLTAGLVFGVLDVLIMVPLKYENGRKKLEAMSAAFVERFALGFLIPNIDLGIHFAWVGLIFGVLLSIPSAVITRVYLPIIGTGIIGGIAVGFIAQAVL